VGEIRAEGASMNKWVEIGRKYARDVISGTIPVCKWIRLACERTESDYEGTDGPYRFDADRAAEVCDFISEFRFVQDSIKTQAGEQFRILPWQAWILITIFGWLWRDTGNRRYRRSYLECGRGNGKSSWSAGVAQYVAFGEGVRGAQVICAASEMNQSRIVLDSAREMASQDKELCAELGLEVLAHKIVQHRTNSRLWALPAKATSAEGLSLNAGILDEVHAQRGRALYDVLSSGCAKRTNSLFWLVTTGGDSTAGIASEIHNYAEKILSGELEDDSFFAALYTVDSGDDWQSPLVWQKANPSWGVSIDPRTIEEECKRARQIPGEQRHFRTRHLCEWFQDSGDVTPFLPAPAVRRCYVPSLDETEFKGASCALGCDLASRLDMCSVASVYSRIENGKRHYYVFCKSFLPEAQRTALPIYTQWEADGELLFAGSETTDQDLIEEFIVTQMEQHIVRDISFDPIQSSMLIGHLEQRGGTMLEVAQSAKYLTPGVLELQEAVTDGRLHTNSKILVWALGNLRMKSVGTNMQQPVRPDDHSKKIDAAVASIMALRSCALKPLDEETELKVWTI
jgi:phage terminase large subunit-like protein